MPRVKTKGEAIAIRLPVHVDDVFQSIAAARGVTARDLAAEVLEEWVDKRKLSTTMAKHMKDPGKPEASGYEEFFQ